MSFCKQSDLSFFSLFDVPDGYLKHRDANLTQTRLCHTSANDSDIDSCRIQFLRQYLPDPAYFVKYLQDAKSNGCDKELSLYVGYWMKTFSKNVYTRPSYNHTRNDVKKTIGKYLRFSSMVQYRLFSGNDSDILINVEYLSQPNQKGWPWTDRNRKCKGNYSDWSCAFIPFTSLSGREFDLFKNLEKNSSILTFGKMARDDIFSYRRTRVNSSVQLLYFGKIASIYAEPNEMVKDYLTKNVVLLRKVSMLTNKNRTAVNRFTSFEQFEGYVTSKFMSEGTSVSMQVRQGDSCDWVIRRWDPSISRIWDRKKRGGQRVRKCFALNVYMEHLYRLHELYNVQTVYLSTDSQDMIDLAKNNSAFDWIFLDNSRQKFHFNESGARWARNWIEFRHDAFNEEILFSSVADLNLLKYGDIFLGQFSSLFSKLAYYVMIGHQPKLYRFFNSFH